MLFKIISKARIANYIANDKNKNKWFQQIHNYYLLSFGGYKI